MRIISISSLLLASATVFSSAIAEQSPLDLPTTFTPPQVFKNTNLLRSIDLTKPYAREVVAVIVENISKEPQNEYFIPVSTDEVDKISYVHARDKSDSLGEFTVSRVELSPSSETQYYRVRFAQSLQPGATITLQLAIAKTSVLSPVPKEISQTDKQYLRWTSGQYFRSAYTTEKQKTKLKLPANSDAPEYTKLSPKSDDTEDPVKLGSAFTYGPYNTVSPDEKSGQEVAIRYEYTAPLIRMQNFTREIEVSHWGGNLAIEEKYWMTNDGARLRDNFSRLKWAGMAYYNPPTSAVKQLSYNLKVGALGPYFTDEIGNVSTSRFRSSSREAYLELKPRYPVFGGWNYSFTLGWNHDLKEFVRGRKNGEEFILRVPFLEGPKEPVVYDTATVTVILPEGATDVRYKAPIPIVKEERYQHKTFMDTLGRTAVKLHLKNVVDEVHHMELIVSYKLPKVEMFRKPFVIFSALSSVFVFSWIVGRIDTRIGK